MCLSALMLLLIWRVGGVMGPAFVLLIDLMSLLGMYLAICGIISHFVGRRSVAASAKSDDCRVEGDLMAIIGCALSIAAWVFFQCSSQIIHRTITWGVTAILPIDLISNEIGAAVDAAVLLGVVVIGFGYIVVSGPKAVKILVPITVFAVPILIMMSGILASREESRRTLIQDRLRRMGTAFSKQHDTMHGRNQGQFPPWSDPSEP